MAAMQHDLDRAFEAVCDRIALPPGRLPSARLSYSLSTDLGVRKRAVNGEVRLVKPRKKARMKK
jgi:hypothetical protein